MEHFGAEATIQAFIDSGVRAALGLAGRDPSKYVHNDDDAFLDSLPAELADKIRGTPPWLSPRLGSRYSITSPRLTNYRSCRMDRQMERGEIPHRGRRRSLYQGQ